MFIVVKYMVVLMDVFTVSLFGHREIDDLMQLEYKLAPIIRELIETKPYISFLIGRNGEFDEYVASIIKRVQKEYRNDNSEINLILPYRVANIEYYEKYYDSVMIPESMHGVHPKFAITLKNRWMIENSDMLIVYVERKKGGAYTALKYAKKLNKKYVNISPYNIV